MRDALIGVIIMLVVGIVADFIYTEKNKCVVGYGETYKCGFLKEQMNIDLKLFDRYW